MKQPRFLATTINSTLVALLLTVFSVNTSHVNPQPNEGVREIVVNFGIVFDEIIPFPLFDTDAIGGVITINTPGRYYFPENITSRIVIDSDSVCLDMNCRSITRSNASENLITVNSNKEKILIKNGALYNTAGPGTGCGVLINNGSSNIYLENLNITDCGNGVRLDGTYGSEITKCEMALLDLVGNTTAIALNYADKNRVYSCCSAQSTQAGYDLLHSKLNCVENCRALFTEGSTSVYGFKSYSGQENLFKDCIIKGTKTDAWEFCNKSYGFLLTGTETETKIIDCIINETDMTSTVSAVSYGIHLDPTLLEYSDLLEEIAKIQKSADTITSVSWSPDEVHIVTGDTDLRIRVYLFDGSGLSQVCVHNAGEPIYSVDWSPDGKYIAIGDDDGLLRVFSFDGATVTEIDATSSLGSRARVAWSPNGKYIAATGGGSRFYVFRFDGSNLTEVNSIAPSESFTLRIAWSPDGKYIVTGGDDNYVRVFRFDGSNIIEVDSDNTATNSINKIAWSPNGKYIVSGDSDNYVRVFSFDGTSIIHLDGDNSAGDVVNAVSWSPNGKYIASSGSGTFNRINIFSFDGSTLTHIKNSATILGNSQQSLWSSSGKYIAAVDTDRYLYVFNAMNTPEGCIIKNNIICDVHSYGQFVGTGITAGGNNCVTKNCCYNNDVNYSYGIPHVYYANQNDTIYPFDNISTPPF